MIMDNLLLLDGSVSSAGVLSGTSVVSGTTFTSGTNTDSANIIDLSQPLGPGKSQNRDVGAADDPALELVCEILTTFTGTGASMQILLQTAPDNGSGSPGSTWTPIVESQVFPVASLAAGSLTGASEIFRTKIPAGVQKFLKATYVVTGANMTAGQILTSIVLDRTYLGPNLGYQSGYSNQYI